MRAPYQILAIPYRWEHGQLRFCVFHRADIDQWQFIAGGGEDRDRLQWDSNRTALYELYRRLWEK